MNPTSIPTYDFFENYDDSQYSLLEIIEDFIFSLENNYFQTWDAVVAQEGKKPLTNNQKEWLDQLISFGEPSTERILYIDERARPKDAWHITANEIAKKLIFKLKSSEIYSELNIEGWPGMQEAIREYGIQLPVPEGIDQAIDIIPASVRHQLEIQVALDCLVGLGQDPTLTLTNQEQHYRIEELIDELSTKQESVRYFDLSIHKICRDFIELPPKDEQIFKQEMINQLGLSDENDFIVGKFS